MTFIQIKYNKAFIVDKQKSFKNSADVLDGILGRRVGNRRGCTI